MKKKTLLFTLIAGMGYVIFSSNASGPVNGGTGNRTGAKASTANCNTGCHTGTLAPTLDIRVDTAGGVEVTKYTAGVTYTVTVTGGHATNTKFGFQLAAVTGTGASQVQAGTFNATSMPAQVAKRSSSGLEIIEQSSTITGPLSKSFTWTAPTTGTADVKMYLTVNAVNGNGSSDGADASENMMITLTKYPAPSNVANVATPISINAFPNPLTTDMLSIQAGNGYDNYAVHITDLQGRSMLQGAVSTVSGTATISTANWAPGMYNVIVTNGANTESIKVVKQ